MARGSVRPVDDGALVAVLHEAADAVGRALASLDDWGPTGRRSQYRSDVVADAAALDVMEAAAMGALSEESGVHDADREILVVLDPVDGSTNGSRGLPWYATSLCALDGDGPRASVVVNQATGARYQAVRGGGARRDGEPIRPSRCTELGQAVVGFAGYCPEHLGWGQFRALGALLVCQEAGAVIADAHGRDLVVRGFEDRRTPLAAATPELLSEVSRRREALVA